MIIPTPEQMAIFGAHEIAWEYKTFDNEHLCYVIRHQQNGKKSFKPITFQNGEWVKRYFVNKEGETLKERPLYNLHLLKLYPEKSILLVEGEKTADAAAEYFPEYNVLSWMGGTGKAKNVILRHLKNKTIYLLPDNDEPGYKAMELLKSRLEDSNKVYLINIKSLPLSKGWDLADLEDGEVDLADVKLLFQDSALLKFQSINPEEFPDLSEKNRPINTSDNIAYLLDFYKIKLRYNLMTNFPEFISPTKKYSKVNESECFFTEISNLCVKNSVPKVDLAQHISFIADRNRYHPAVHFIESRSWDGISRINDLLSTVHAENQSLANKLIYRWLISCVAAAYSEEGISLEGVLVFQGKQKVGKSYWFLKLVPEEYRYLVKSSLSLDPNNKDSVMDCTSSWLGELAEIDGTIKKSDVSAQKQFITKSIDYYRVPFGRMIRGVPRRTAFFGSVNPTYFLSDETGNRRYWSISVKEIDYEHRIDMQQFWAEIKFLFDNGESYRLTKEEQELIDKENESFITIDPLEEEIIKKYHWTEVYRNNPMSVNEVLASLNFTIHEMRMGNLNKKCSEILSKLTGKKSRKSNGRSVFDLPRQKSYQTGYQSDS